MDFFALIAARHSVRAFQSRLVSAEQVRRIVGAANRAPSAGDRQAYEIVAVTSSDRRGRLMRAALGQRHVAQAPLVLVFVTHPERNRERYGDRGAQLYCLQDATLAAAYAQLAAQALGLSSVWVGAFDDAEVLAAVDAPPGIGASSLLAIGYPAEVPEATPRRLLEDLVHQETLSNIR
jgi:nitroreductase